MCVVASVLIPCRNERRYISEAVRSLLDQEFDDGEIEILIADGMSDDGTRVILAELAANHGRVTVLDNPDGRVPAALVLLLEAARGQFLIRADAHCVYPNDYVRTLVSFLQQTDADNVGGKWETVPGDASSRAQVIAACLASKFGVGLSYRTCAGREPIDVDTVPFGAWRRGHFEKFGPFDPFFVRAQDLEHNVRVKKRGGRIVCLPWLRIRYFARCSFSQLGRMGFQYGYWKVPVAIKHRMRFSIRQFFPPFLVLGTAASLPVALVWSWILVFPVAYLLAVGAAAVAVGQERGLLRAWPALVYTFLTIHFSYGVGYLKGIWDGFVLCRFRFPCEELDTPT